MSNFYTADLHLGHANIIKLNNRPFKTIEEMDKTLIENWNKVVTPNDDIYILGDLCYRTHHDNMLHYISQLKGRKHLIVGNHDTNIVKDADLRRYFVEITSYKEIVDGPYKLVLFHYPIVEWNGYFRNAIHLYGHIHNNFNNPTTQYISNIPNAYNVGADILGYTPRTIEEIIKKSQ